MEARTDLRTSQLTRYTYILIDGVVPYWLGELEGCYFIVYLGRIMDVGEDLENAQRLFLGGLNRLLRRRWNR